MQDLMSAVMAGDIERVSHAIRIEEVNQRDEAGRTPLMAAVYRNRVPIAEMLIHAGADVEAADKEGYNVLYYAAAHGKFESTYLLYESGVRLDRNDPGFLNALGAAKEQGHNHIVELLEAAEKKRREA